MLELIAVICAFVVIPIALVLPNLPLPDDRDGGLGHVPYFMAAALVGWWFLGIWVPYALTALCGIYAFGAYLQAKQAREQAQASKVVIHRKAEPLGGADVWRGPQMTSDQADPDAIDARTREARKRRMAAYPSDGGQRSQPHQSSGDSRRDADGEWKLSRREWIATIDNPAIADAGLWAKFEYVDADGVITNREIRHWSKRGAYIEGFCMLRRESRNFRQDRINHWVSG